MKIRIFFAFLAVFLLFGCSRSSNMDIHIFINGFNKASETVDLSVEKCVFTTDNNITTHYCKVNKNTLLTLSSLPDGTIYRCTVTFEHSGNFAIFEDCVKSAITSFCNGKSEEATKIKEELNLVQSNLSDGFSSRLTTDWYTFNCESTEKNTVFIIRAKRYSSETNTSPTLKEH